MSEAVGNDLSGAILSHAEIPTTTVKRIVSTAAFVRFEPVIGCNSCPAGWFGWVLELFGNGQLHRAGKRSPPAALRQCDPAAGSSEISSVTDKHVASKHPAAVTWQRSLPALVNPSNVVDGQGNRARWVSIVSELGRLADADIDEPQLAVPVVVHRIVAEHIDQPDIGSRSTVPVTAVGAGVGFGGERSSPLQAKNIAAITRQTASANLLVSTRRQAGSCVKGGVID